MEEDVVENKRRLLEKVLEELSSRKVDDSDLNRIAHVLESVYVDGYRQMYSELYPKLILIQNGPKGDLEVLLINLEAIRALVREDFLNNEGQGQFKDYLYGSVLKLCDHINLECQRIEQNRDLDERLKDSVKKVQKLEAKTIKAMKKARNLQLEMVAILAIFAAIVVAFAGGLNLLGSSLSGVGQSDLLDLLSVLSLCGLVLFNTVAFLMHTVIWIIRRQNDTVHTDKKILGENDESIFVDPVYIIIANITLIAIFGVTTYYALI